MLSFAIIVRDVPHKTLYTTDGVKRAAKNIELEEVFEWLENDPIWAQRGKAIQSYAELEHALATVMMRAGSMSHETAVTMFYKMTNSQARNATIERLLHKRHKNKFNPFWNGYFKALRSLDIKRNEIVHWVAAANVGISDENIIHTGITLIPPASLTEDASEMGTGPSLSTTDLTEFGKKCGEFAQLAVMFAMANDPPPQSDAARMSAWRDMFQKPFQYPLPADHLLFQKASAPGGRPPSPSG